MSGKTTLMAMIAACAFWLLAAAMPSTAFAQCCAPPSPPPSCNCTPPPCCTPPSPPPSSPPCCMPGHNVNIPGVNVFVAPSVQVNVQASAQARAGASAGSTVFYSGGGGGGYYGAPGATGVISGLNVEGGLRRTAYEATRSMYKKVVIQAFCFDDKEVPHPASQVSPDRDIDDAYDGELYRCIAGAHMQITIAEWREKVSFEGGQTISCQKGEALYHVPGVAGGAAGGHGAGASLQCRPQKPARDCNERSLLRRFGAGIKVLTIMYTERYTAYREESTSSSASIGMSLDGGVGGVAY
jgi:hypothetical protein